MNQTTKLILAILSMVFIMVVLGKQRIERDVAPIVTPIPINLTVSKPVFDADDVECLAMNIYHESRGKKVLESYAVSFVVLNRMKHPRYPNTACDIIYQYKQFSWTSKRDNAPDLSNFIERTAWKRSHDLAESFVSLVEQKKLIDITDGSLYYHATNIRPYWVDVMVVTVTYGEHTFLREKRSSENR